MNRPAYPFSTNKTSLVFEFDSISEFKLIRKRIEYAPTEISELYNLALGDVGDNGEVDDSIVSDNDDRDTVLATVVQTILAFFQAYPQRAVYIEGNDERRTRLYRAVISRELDNSRDLFDIYGIYEHDDIEPFVVNRRYVAFIIRSKL